MLRFILGAPATGKTYYVIDKIKELSANGLKALLIVPEQFTFESERAILSALGDKAALNVTVLSFSRLCDEIGSISGGIAGKVLGDADKVIFMHRALNSVKDSLKLWGRYTRNVNFSSTMLDAIGEFKINAITPDDLRLAAERVESAALKAKLLDIALIYETYDTLMGERFIDPADRLTKLHNQLETTKYFKDKTVFLDSFKGFTGQQFKIIERIFAQSKDVYVSFTDNPKVLGEYCIYANIRKAAEKIKRIAKAYSTQIADPIILENSYANNKGIIALEKMLSSSEEISIETDDKINLVFAGTVFDEAEFAARTVRKLVRTKGYRYRDFVIIARDSEKYEDAVATACKKNGISCFYDKRMPLSDFPLSVAAASAIEALKFSTENILRFHKTGLGTLSYEEISKLENYTYLWNIDGSIWLNTWDMDTRGFVADDNVNEKAVEELQYINSLRERAIAPLIDFKASFKGNAANMAAAIVKLFRACNSAEKMANMCEGENVGKIPYSSDLLRSAYDIYMDILDSLVISFGDASIDTEYFADALKVAVSKASVGVIPQCLDQVTFGAADRIRPSRPKIAFILGANQGVFPKNVSNNGIFNILERKALIESEINIEDNSVYSSIEEDYLVYCNLCCPSDELFISYSSRSLTGEKCEPSAFIDNIKNNLPFDIFYEPSSELDFDNLPETADSLYSEVCRRIRTSPSDALTLSNAVSGDEREEKIGFINTLISEDDKKISPETAQSLYKNNINMSATKLDTLNRCRFSYFCRYGLGAKKLQPADFDVLQRGTIVHFVLERFITVYGKGITELSDTELDKMTDEFINQYLDSVSGFRSVETARTRFLISRVSRSLKEVVRHLAIELKQSDFEPVACEMKIGAKGIPLEFPFEGGKLKINGSIDRVDEYNGYIRIIDYKTGSKSFKLPDILFGLNLQMLLYLYAVIRGRNLPDDKAAGILYMPSKRDLNGNGMAMNGLLKLDTSLSYAMDKSGEGEFIPKLRLNRDGTPSKLNKTYIEPEKFSEIFDYIEKLMIKTGKMILSGDIAVSPLDGREAKACAYCDFASVCGIEDKQALRVPDLSNDAVFDAMKGDEIDADKAY